MKDFFVFIYFLIFTSTAWSQNAADESTSSFYFFTDILGKKGLIAAVGLLFFFYSYKNSVKLFDWIEEQTFGTRDYILKKFEIMHIKINPDHLTYILLFMSIGSGVLIFGLMAIWGNIYWAIILGIMFTIVGWKSPKPIVDLLEEIRMKKYTSQMADALNLLANGIRAGLSMPQAIGMVVDELPNPISQEFNLVLQQAKIGVPLDEALENLNKRVPTPDNQMFVTSVNILRETGGNLAEVFETIVMVIRERVRLQQKIDTYVAQGKAQGFTIFAMPYGMIIVNGAADSEYLSMMFTTPIGIIMFLLILGFSLTGLWVIFKIIKVKI